MLGEICTYSLVSHHSIASPVNHYTTATLCAVFGARNAYVSSMKKGIFWLHACYTMEPSIVLQLL